MTLSMISILMPIKNAAHTLETALSSITDQSFYKNGGNLECVLVNDGSTDASAQVISAHFKVNTQIKLKLFTTSGIGISKALNLGLEQCAGDWVARLDADDRCHPDRLKKQLDYSLQNPNLALVGCKVSHWVLDPTGNGEGQNYEGMSRYINWANSIHTHAEMSQALWIDSPLPHPSWLVRRKVFEIIGPYSEDRSVPEDYEWLHRFFHHAETNSEFQSGKEDSYLLEWRESSNRLTRKDPAYSEDAFLKTKLTYLKKRKGLSDKKVFLFGLGPKGKKVLDHWNHSFPLAGLVDVNPRREGMRYRELPVYGIKSWKNIRLKIQNPDEIFVLNCLGTPQARMAAEGFCRENGLIAGQHFLSL